MYIPSKDRYQNMQYNRCGRSGLLLPRLSIGLWHNFGNITPFGVQATTSAVPRIRRPRLTS